jgi:N-acetylmuramic acid 6-phosphate etherase
MEVSGAGREAARAAIQASGGSVRTAIVMAARGVGREQAESLLAEHDNHLRPIIGDPPAPLPAPSEE